MVHQVSRRESGLEAFDAASQKLESSVITGIEALLEICGENPNREDLQETPARFLKAFRELTSGYSKEPKEILSKVFREKTDELVVLSGLPFHSLCEHHLLPFYGVATIAYIPAGGVVGLSKIPRLLDCFSKRFQVQERLTNQIADSMISLIEPKPLAAAAILTARHSCMCMRGIKSEGMTTTSAIRGEFKKDRAARQELLHLHEAAK